MKTYFFSRIPLLNVSKYMDNCCLFVNIHWENQWAKACFCTLKVAGNKTLWFSVGSRKFAASKVTSATKLLQMCHMRSMLRIFSVIVKSYFTFSRYLSFYIFNNPMIYQICEIMISISTWDRVQFGINLLNHNSLSHQTLPINRIN